ncbi:MAG TPA: hypothetical protein VIW45_16940 [Vicinamibacterales bacterium]|jgi:hypothetical protein
MRRTGLIAGLLLLTAATLRGQERIGSGTPTASYRPGWTFTPTVGLSETYDDNISLFGQNTADTENNDFVRTYFPQADLHYSGRQTQFGSSYSGSFLDYQTHGALNRWDQRGRIELRREESARVKWFAHGNAAWLPTTDLIDLAGIPFRHNGARTLDARAGVEYLVDSRNALTTSVNVQDVTFDRPDNVQSELVGGQMLDSLSTWRHRLDERIAVGADYSYRRAYLAGAVDVFDVHTTQAAVDVALSPEWSVSAGAGVVYVPSTATMAGRTGPAYRASVERHREGRTFHAGYERSYIPAFGIGGVVQNDEVRLGLRVPLFHSRSWYSDTGAVFRNDVPLADQFVQLPLRSLRAYTVVGWSPQPWMHIEGFYARTDQSSLRAGGRLDRNRIGFQIVTSKPMRIE